ncbi:MAG: transcription elongation factor GreA [Myxococcales bacterium]|nr:transcription elongation factor GreA [Myxococcales bacterium]
MSDRIPMTPAGLRKLREELKHLQSVERPRITQEIEVARGHGDLSENAEYHAAKERQSHIEGRILDINGWLSRAEVIDPKQLRGSDQVVFGATVVLVDQDSEKEVTYRIVGEPEADLKKRWVSVTSPLARSLIGKRVGEIALVHSPGGSREYEVSQVRFEDDEAA